MKKLITLFLTCFSLTLFAQGITVGSANCYGSTFPKIATTTTINGKTRNIYQTATERITFTATAGGQWEIQFQGVADFTSSVSSYPKPPSASFGNWTKVTGTCGTLSLAGDVQTTLSIELTAFDVQNTEGGKNTLTWATASEVNNKVFDIERSTDGSTFHPIGQVKGNNKPSSYQYVDNQPFATSYYRLRQIDFDGTETYSQIVSVELKGKGKGLKVYPTLVTGNILTVDTEGGQLRDYSVINLLGQQVLVGKTTQQIDVSSLAKGTYMLKVGAEVTKFVKQ